MPSASPDSLAAAQRAYDLLNTDFPQVDAPSLAALRDALSASTSHFPPTAALVASLEWAATQPPRPPAAPQGELVGLCPLPAPPSSYAEVYAVGCVERAAAAVAAYAEGRLAVAEQTLRRYEPRRAEPACADDGSDVEAAAAAIAASAVGGEDDQSGVQSGPADGEVWAADPDDDDVPYEPLQPLQTAGPDAACAPLLLASRPHADLAPAPLQARLEGLVGSLGYAPLAPLPRDAPLHARTLAATVAAVRAAAAAAAAGSLDAAAAERLAWPLLSLARERVRAAPDETIEQLPRFLAALDGARGWRRRFLASLLPDGLPPPPARAWLALEAAVKTELPPLLAELSSPAAAAAPPANPTALLLSLASCYVDPPPQHAARAAEALLASGVPQLLLQRRIGAGERGDADASAEWSWLLRACCRHRTVLSFCSRVPALLAAIRSSAHLSSRGAERLTWLWSLAVERRQPPLKGDAEVEAEALVALQAACSAAAPLPAEADGGTADTDEHLRARSERALCVLELLETLRRTAAGALPPQLLLLSPAGSPLWAAVQEFGAGARVELARRRGANGEAAAAGPGGRQAGATGEQKLAELLERVGLAVKSLQLLCAAPSKGD